MEHLFIVSYDISEPKRWRRIFRIRRRIFRIMCGYGEWLQLSVFQCRLSQARVLQLEAALREVMNQSEDHVLMVDVGPAEQVVPPRPQSRQAV